MTLEVRGSLWAQRIWHGDCRFDGAQCCPRGLGANISGYEIWSTNSMPVDNSMEAEASHRAGFVKKYNYVGGCQGTTVRIVEWTPDTPCSGTARRPWTIRWVLSGEIDVEFDSGQVVTMKQGDIIVMRGVTYRRKNKSRYRSSPLSSSPTPFPSRPLARRGASSFQREAILVFARDRQALSILRRQGWGELSNASS